jgi:hypothetical protein
VQSVSPNSVIRLYVPMEEAKKPYVVWVDYGTDGWKPMGYDSLDEALRSQKHMPDWVITKAVKWKAVEE